VREGGREGGREGEVRLEEEEEEEAREEGEEESVEVVIVGAGFAGICLAVKLKEVREGGREGGREGVKRMGIGDIRSNSYLSDSLILSPLPPSLPPSLPRLALGLCVFLRRMRTWAVHGM